MKERSISFSFPMIVAIIEDRKTQTRRTIKNVLLAGTPSPLGGVLDCECIMDRDHLPSRLDMMGQDTDLCPYGVIGDRLRVKEAYYAWGKWVPNGKTKGGRNAWKFVPVGTSIRYMDGNKHSKTAKRDGECGWAYRHGRFMPKAHSRITLEITEIRAQRLQEITNNDAKAEGVYCAPHRGATCGMADTGIDQCAICPYRDLWDSLQPNLKPENFWHNNPWVFAISFRKI